MAGNKSASAFDILKIICLYSGKFFDIFSLEDELTCFPLMDGIDFI